MAFGTKPSAPPRSGARDESARWGGEAHEHDLAAVTGGRGPAPSLREYALSTLPADGAVAVLPARAVDGVAREPSMRPSAPHPEPRFAVTERFVAEVELARHVRSTVPMHVQVPAPVRVDVVQSSGEPEERSAVAPEASASLRVSVSSPLFRAEALAAHRRGERVASVVSVTSASRWTLLAALLLAVGLAGAVLALGTIEEVSAARGVLRASAGVQAAVAQVGGTLREVLVRPGQHVLANQVIARIDATPLRAQLEEAELRLSALERQWSTEQRVARGLHERSVQLLRTRERLLAKRLERHQSRLRRRATRADKLAQPELAGVLDDSTRDVTADALDGAHDDSLRMADELAALRLAIANESAQHEQQRALGEQRLNETRAHRDSVLTLISQTELRAPAEGRLESLRAHPGQLVQAGEWIARIVRENAEQQLVAFVPERERAFLRAGARAQIEVDQLPVAEFGLVPAKVVRVAGELADPSELASALGDAVPSGPHVRVELVLQPDAKSQRAVDFMRSGTLVTARITLRERRLLALVFEPARKWLH